MGLFAYSRLITSLAMRKVTHKPYILIPAVTPMLISTPTSIRTLIALSYLDPLSLLEERLKRNLTLFISNQQIKIT